MKKLLAVIITVFSICSANAQVLTPDFKNQPMLLKDGKLVKLEKVQTEVKQKVNGMGYGGVSQNITIPGPTSSTKTGSNPEFIIKVDDGTDPETLLYLSKCLEHKKVREVEVSKTSAFAAYGATGKSASRFHVKLIFEKAGDNLYKIKVGEKLDPSEYAFVFASSGAQGQMSSVFCFTTH